MKEFSRRDFLKLGAAGVGALAVWGVHEQFQDYSLSLEYLNGLKPSPNALPKSLQGLTINSPFLYNRDIDYINWVKNYAEMTGTGNIRILIGNLVEKSIGSYNKRVIDDIKKLAKALGNIGLIVSLFDAYPLLHSDKFNIDYESGELSSPYFFSSPGNSKDEKQFEFFRNQRMNNSIDERFDFIIEQLRNIYQISAWEVGNEFVVPKFEGANRKEVLTDWYEGRIERIRRFDKTRPVITGLNMPWLIDEKRFVGKNVVNSFHAYPLQPWVTKGLSKFVENSLLPLSGLEVGVQENLKTVITAPLYIYQVLTSSIIKERLYTGGIGLWKLDKGQDGYDISREDKEYLTKLSLRLKEIQSGN